MIGCTPWNKLKKYEWFYHMHDNGQCQTQLGISILHGGKMKKSYESNISWQIVVFIKHVAFIQTLCTHLHLNLRRKCVFDLSKHQWCSPMWRFMGHPLARMIWKTISVFYFLFKCFVCIFRIYQISQQNVLFLPD